MDKLRNILAISATLLTILDVILRNVKSFSILRFLISPLLSINILEILILLFLIVLMYHIIPPNLTRFLHRQRAKRFYENWKKFKNVLVRYTKIRIEENRPLTRPMSRYHGMLPTSLVREYEKLREKLEEDFNYFAPLISRIQKSTHRGDDSIAIKNFEYCFSVRDVREWHVKVGRDVPRALDCFDYLLISLKELCVKSHFK